MRKDLQHLNTWWYRLFKVLFVFFFVTSICGIALVAYFVHMPYTQNDYRIQCNYGYKDSFIAYKEKHIYIPDSSIEADGTVGRVSPETKQKLQDACGITDDDINKVLNSMWDDLTAGKPITIPPLFTATPVSYTIGTTTKAIEAALIAVVILIIIFEIIRRSFFYIVTGEFFPRSLRVRKPRF